MRGRILVVDDSPVMRRLMVRTLGEAGVPFEEICEAHNGLEAVHLLERESVRLILLDPIMPVMDGEELLARVRADDQHRDVPVMAIGEVVWRRQTESDSTAGVEVLKFFPAGRTALRSFVAGARRNQFNYNHLDS